MKCTGCHFENPADTYFCGKCGTRLDAPAKPAIADVPAPEIKGQASFTKTLETTTDELARGTLFAGRYEIIEELGAGGMGRVYRAFDTRIKEEVALKLLRPEVASRPKTVERFRNEIRLARKIVHKNVCRMFDMGEERSTHFITMEYVAGEDLKSFIRRVGQLPAGKSVFIGRQIAEGLAEAHKIGVVHRDLKPGNIMIDKDGDAKIMDFGIARSLAGGGTTVEGAIIGTPEYMSPEQVEGKEADQRTDIYALGIILFEMVTGRVPFEGATPFSIANKHKTEPAPVAAALNPQVPQELSRLILRCMEKPPEKRYQTTEELLLDLGTIEAALPTTEPTTGRMPSRTRPKTSREITVKFRPRRLVVPIAIVLVLASAFFLWRFVFRPKPAPSPAASSMPTLAVLNFENLSRDENLDFWRRGLPELLINGLYQSRFIKVLTREDSDAILKKLGLAEAKGYTSDDLARIGGEGQLTHIVTGSFLKAGDRIVVTLTLLDPRTRNVIQRRNVECQNQDEMFSKANDLTLQVKKDLNLSSEQLSADAEVYKKLEIATTSSAEAYKLFLEGRRLHGAMSYEESIAYMEKAVEIDPQFAMAYRSMASAYWNLGEAGKALKFGRKALELSGRLPELERMLIEAFYYQWAGDIRKAIEINEQVLKTYPENLMARGNLGGLTPDLDRSIALREFVFQRHKTGITIFNLADAYMEKGLYQKAEEVCRLYLRDIEDDINIDWALYYAHLCRRQFDAAFVEAEKKALSEPNAASFFKALMGDTLLLKDDFAGADKIYQQVFLMSPTSGRFMLTGLDLSRGKFDEAIRRSRQLLTDARGGKDAPNAYWLLTAALEKGGRYDEASQVWVQYLQDSAALRKSELDAPRPYLPSEQLYDLFIRGRIQAEMKSFDEAQQTANELKSLGEKSVDPRDLRFYEYVLGLVELEKKNPRQAASLFARACQRLRFETILWEESRDHPLYFEGLARAYYESRELDKARQEFEKITLLTIARWSHGDIYAKTFYMLGKIAEQQGDKALAREKYQKFLDLWKDADPGLPEVADAKKRLAGL